VTKNANIPDLIVPPLKTNKIAEKFKPDSVPPPVPTVKSTDIVIGNPQLTQQPPTPRTMKPGRKRKYSHESIMKLEKLGFDPIEEMVKLFHDIQAQITFQENEQEVARALTAKGDYKTRTRYSAMAHSALMESRRNIIVDLMRYRYGRVPETVNLTQKDLPPMVIQLAVHGGDPHELTTYVIGDPNHESMLPDLTPQLADSSDAIQDVMEEEDDFDD
jgi:hypothetical protein